MFVSLPIGAFIAAFCVLVPTPWHWRARSVPTLSMIAWLFIGNLTFAINAVIWVDSVRIVVPVWCDIVTKLQMGATVGLPAACLCLAIRLESIASVRNATVTHQMKVRRIIFDLCMCWGLPMLYMTLHTVVQGHRFDIVENFGCRPTIYVSVVAIFLVFIPPLVLSVGTLGFAGMALVHFFRRRVTFAKHLAQTDSAMTSARYFRLMLMAIVEMVFTTVISSLNVWFTSRDGLRPWLGWDGVHSGFKQIGQFPFAFIPTSDRQWTFVLWWSVPVTSYVFFIFFAFGEDAMKEYRKVLPWFRHRILRRRPSDANSPYSGPYTVPKPLHLSSFDSQSTYARPICKHYPASKHLTTLRSNVSTTDDSTTSPTTPSDAPAPYYFATLSAASVDIVGHPGQQSYDDKAGAYHAV